MSAIPIRSLVEARSDGFRRRFLGTHFFNPPRYLHLLEISPTAETLPVVIDAVADFSAPFPNQIDPLTGADTKVVIALRADVEIALELGAVEHGIAGRTLDPQAFGHGLAHPALAALDLGRQQLLQPAHRSSAARTASMLAFGW